MVLTAIVAALFLSLGLTCLVWPREVQRFVLGIYQGHGGRRTGLLVGFMAGSGHLVMLRLLGVLWTAVGLCLIALLTLPGLAVFQ